MKERDQNPYFQLFEGLEVKLSDITREVPQMEQTVESLVDNSNDGFVGQYFFTEGCIFDELIHMRKELS